MAEARELGGGSEAPFLEVQYVDPFLVVCRCFSVVTAVNAILCVIVNVFSAIRSFKNGEDVFDGILGCYAVVIAMFVAVAETESERIINFWKILEYWIGRDMLQIFVAVMTKALSSNLSKRRAEAIMHQMASYMLLACGVVYLIAGLLCMGTLKRHRLQEAERLGQAAKDLEEVDRRRKELQGLLRGRS